MADTVLSGFYPDSGACSTASAIGNTALSSGGLGAAGVWSVAVTSVGSLAGRVSMGNSWDPSAM